jgi:uncharacterized protein YqgV (UPF0045/DUF77 family)
MVASAQIAIYPLRQERLTPAVAAVQQALGGRGLDVQPGPMSTYVVGEVDPIFAALREAFVEAASTGHVVMTITVSNACPVPD